MAISRTKVAIIGAGKVGAALAYHLTVGRICDDLLLVESWTTPELQQAHCQTEIFAKLQALKAQFCENVEIDKFDW